MTPKTWPPVSQVHSVSWLPSESVKITFLSTLIAVGLFINSTSLWCHLTRGTLLYTNGVTQRWGSLTPRHPMLSECPSIWPSICWCELTQKFSINSEQLIWTSFHIGGKLFYTYILGNAKQPKTFLHSVDFDYGLCGQLSSERHEVFVSDSYR